VKINFAQVGKLLQLPMEDLPVKLPEVPVLIWLASTCSSAARPVIRIEGAVACVLERYWPALY